MAMRRNPKYWIEKKAGRKTGYPLGTIAFYGPDNITASKVVVGIVPSGKDNAVDELRKWFIDAVDVRKDQAINQEILEFLDQHNVQRVAMTGRIIGCPHEEGIDYPEGEVCPQCPYWANRDRWTGELLT